MTQHHRLTWIFALVLSCMACSNTSTPSPDGLVGVSDSLKADPDAQGTDGAPLADVPPDLSSETDVAQVCNDPRGATLATVASSAEALLTLDTVYHDLALCSEQLDDWYRFVAAATGQLYVKVLHQALADTECFRIRVFSDKDDAGSALTAVQTDYLETRTTLTLSVASGQSYFVQLSKVTPCTPSSANLLPGPYSLSVNSACVDDGDCANFSEVRRYCSNGACVECKEAAHCKDSENGLACNAGQGICE